jgi:2-iminobutanoate/2-iminopropanoate deaminase
MPFSLGILSGDFLYLSGSIGTKPGTRELPEGIEAQTKQTMDNLASTLKAAGMDFSDVVQSTVYLSDSRHFRAFNEAYRPYFSKDPPTRATVEADIAIPGALTEIAMVAVRPGIERRAIVPQGTDASTMPFSPGILAGNTLFVSGMLGRDAATNSVTSDVGSQTRQTLENIGRVLEAADMDFKDVVSCRVFLDDARFFQDMNEAYRSFFPENPPARATVRARLMGTAYGVEIQCTAVRDPSRKVVVAEEAQRSSSPFSPAIQVGNRLYLSGFIGRGPDGYGDIKAQTRQTLENLKGTLQAAGMDFSNVDNVMVFVSDIRYFADMNEVYREMMPTPPPARATVGAQLVSPVALVEIMMEANK